MWIWKGIIAEQITISIQLSDYPVDFDSCRFGRVLLLKEWLLVSNYPIIQVILKVVDFEGFEKCAYACVAHNSKETKPVI